jgi:hypothetical protein
VSINLRFSSDYLAPPTSILPLKSVQPMVCLSDYLAPPTSTDSTASEQHGFNNLESPRGADEWHYQLRMRERENKKGDQMNHLQKGVETTGYVAWA